MSRTLFWYMFWNLLRVFLLTALNLAGMMTFAMLLRPLTQNGLDMGQVNKVLMYMTPAMTTYSIPVAALFAATMVYGKFAADNELTAMRACGIGYLAPGRFSIALPALVLGLLTATISLLLLCFVVPIFMLKVEQVVRTNIGNVMVSQISRSHSVQFAQDSGDVNIFAEAAQLLPADPRHPQDQRVELLAPAMITEYDKVNGISVPRSFRMARSAIVTIAHGPAQPGSRSAGSETTTVSVQLFDGIKFPRQFYGNIYAGVGDTTFGPIEIPSPVHENVKFMNVQRLTEQAADPGQGQRVRIVVAELIRAEQQRTYLNMIATSINRPEGDGNYRFDGDVDNGDAFQIGGVRALAEVKGDELIVTAPATADQARPVALVQSHGSQETLRANGKEMHVRVSPDPINRCMSVGVDLYNVVLTTQGSVSQRGSFPRGFTVPMPPPILRIADKTLSDYKNDPSVTLMDAGKLRHEEIVVNNAARSELHGRASFAISCLTLVMVGSALGMMFKSGNFLNAFAISFIPALICITLIFCGQSAATHVPNDFGKIYHDPLPIALGFIWTGNIVVLATAIYLTVKLQTR
jgi:lipopolysaccharide export LptBFGC system permease protein LptF